jgi:shikimate dehydrogenase
MNQRFGLIGETLSYSYSKLIHEFISSYYNMDITYDLLEVEDLSEINFQMYEGLNITYPYKKKILDYLEYIDEDAKIFGCVNTVDFNLRGYNTDIIGFLYLVDKVIDDFDTIVILGSGAMSEMIKTYYNNKSVTVVSRTGAVNYNNLEMIRGDLLINTTPTTNKVNPQEIVTEEFICKFRAVVDLNYNPNINYILNYAAKNHINNTNGLDMLIIQAIKAFEIWHDLKVDGKLFLKVKNHIEKLSTPLVAIIAMPLSGKSTLIKNMNGYDLDDEIQLHTGLSNDEFINVMGIEKFRRVESEVLARLVYENKSPIALGGGIVTDFKNRELLFEYRILHLNVDLNTLKSRYQPGIRPLINSKEDIEKLFALRKLDYDYFKTGDYDKDFDY